MSVDPLASKYAGWSSYHYVMNNPLIYIDPDGRNGILIIDKEAGTVTVKVDFHFSTDTKAAFTEKGYTNVYVSDEKFKNYIQDNWGGSHSIKIDGQSYAVRYNIEIVSHSTHEQAIEAWKSDPASNLLLASESGNNSYYAAETRILRLNVSQQKDGDGKTFSHEVGHALGLGHNSYKDKNGRYSISSVKRYERGVVSRDVENTVTEAVLLAERATTDNKVNILLETGRDENRITVQNPDGTNGESSTYKVPNNQK